MRLISKGACPLLGRARLCPAECALAGGGGRPVGADHMRDLSRRVNMVLFRQVRCVRASARGAPSACARRAGLQCGRGRRSCCPARCRRLRCGQARPWPQRSPQAAVIARICHATRAGMAAAAPRRAFAYGPGGRKQDAAEAEEVRQDELKRFDPKAADQEEEEDQVPQQRPHAHAPARMRTRACTHAPCRSRTAFRTARNRVRTSERPAVCSRWVRMRLTRAARQGELSVVASAASVSAPSGVPASVRSPSRSGRSFVRARACPQLPFKDSTILSPEMQARAAARRVLPVLVVVGSRAGTQVTLHRLHGEDVSWRLLYRASQHGFSADAFHQRVGTSLGAAAAAVVSLTHTHCCPAGSRPTPAQALSLLSRGSTGGRTRIVRWPAGC
jgi:hypothetical protein